MKWRRTLAHLPLTFATREKVAREPKGSADSRFGLLHSSCECLCVFHRVLDDLEICGFAGNRSSPSSLVTPTSSYAGLLDCTSDAQKAMSAQASTSQAPAFPQVGDTFSSLNEFKLACHRAACASRPLRGPL